MILLNVGQKCDFFGRMSLGKAQFDEIKHIFLKGTSLNLFKSRQFVGWLASSQKFPLLWELLLLLRNMSSAVTYVLILWTWLIGQGNKILELQEPNKSNCPHRILSREIQRQGIAGICVT